jgi:hypothetical protein
MSGGRTDRVRFRAAAYARRGCRVNPSLLARTKIPGRQTMDRMLAVRFEVPEKALQARKSLRLHIVEVGGPEADLVEGQP